MIKVFDNVLNSEELEAFTSDMNMLAGLIICPHTDRLLKSVVIEDSLNNLRPRANCLKADIGYNVNSDRIKHILNERDVKMHDAAHFGQWLTKRHFPKALHKIISKNPVDLKGVEWWGYDSIDVKVDGRIAVPIHVDYDGGLEMLTGEVVCPELTYVFYDMVDEDLEGGELVIYETNQNSIIDTIKPKNNRLIVFSGGMPHEVLGFNGHRRSFIILPWKNRPREFL
tara:strand:- start:102 stop:779 length:678 start_codon:yes stop_codon:yes gene_type:complete